MAALYEIANEILALLQQADDGLMPPDLEAALDALEMDLEKKLDHVMRFVRVKEASASVWTSKADQFEEEKRRLAALALADAVEAERWKRYVKAQVERLGRPVETEFFRLAVQRNGGRPAIRLKGGAPIPPGYEKQPPPELDKDKVYADLQAGKTLPDVILVERASHLKVQ